MALAWSLLVSAIPAVLMSVLTGEVWARTGSRRLLVAADQRREYRQSMRLRAWFLAPPAFLAFWMFVGGDLVGFSEIAKTLGFFGFWLVGGNLMLLLANKLPSIRKFTELGAAGVNSLNNGEHLTQ